jgi:hypothetical protein
MALSKVSEMDNTMTKSKRTTELIIIHKALHRKLKLEQLKPRVPAPHVAPVVLLLLQIR